MRTLLLGLLLAAALLPPATGAAQVEPPDESLTDQPGPESLDAADTTTLLTPETVTAASPSELVRQRSRRRRSLFGRRDSTYVDTVGVGFFNKILAPVYPNPERAAVMSFLVPGAGQLYNRRFAWLKVPIIYAGYAALIYNGIDNRRRFKEFDEVYNLAVNDLPFDPPGPRFTNPRAILTQRDRFDKNFQLSYIGLGIFHLVQTLEAYTTGHLLDFDMDESLTLAPVMISPPPGTRDRSEPQARLGVSARWSF